MGIQECGDDLSALAIVELGAAMFGAGYEDQPSGKFQCFVRLREISAAVDVPKRIASFARAHTATLVFSGRNIWLWTKEFTGLGTF